MFIFGGLFVVFGSLPIAFRRFPFVGQARKLGFLTVGTKEKLIFSSQRSLCVSWISVFLRDSWGIQTLNLLIRSQMLYSVELRSRPSFEESAAKVHAIFLRCKFFGRFFTFARFFSLSSPLY